jgi:hypothetical protein
MYPDALFCIGLHSCIGTYLTCIAMYWSVFVSILSVLINACIELYCIYWCVLFNVLFVLHVSYALYVSVSIGMYCLYCRYGPGMYRLYWFGYLYCLYSMYHMYFVLYVLVNRNSTGIISGM